MTTPPIFKLTYVIFSNFQNSHAICDLGLSITKRLAPKENDLQGLPASVSLPSMLYKPYEKKEGDDSMVRDLFLLFSYWIRHVMTKSRLLDYVLGVGF